MNKQDFENYIKNKIIYLDGGTGSNLIKRGMTAGACPEKWIIENSEVMIELQKEYIAAGSNIILAPTFTANRIKLEEYNMADDIEKINMELVAVSKKAADGKALVAGDMSMTGRQLAPMGTMDFEELVDIYKEQAGYLFKAGVDLFIIETMMSLQETRAAVIAVKETCNLPIIASMTFEADGRSLYGTDAKSAAIVLDSLGVSAVGANCSSGPDQMIKVIREMREVTSLPLLAKPNAGIPSLAPDGSTIYDMNSETFSIEMVPMVEAGASLIGGCCGTSPEFIRKMVAKTIDLTVIKKAPITFRRLASERRSLTFFLDDNFLIVGERINPTGKKKLQAELREGSLEMVAKFAEEQEERGASVLDINMGMSGIDEKEMMLRVIDEVTGITSLPLSIDSSHVEVMEAALRRYPGRALINSISLEKVKFDNLLPIAKKYGAMFILLPLSDAGLPQNMEEKKSIITTIVNKALDFGMNKEDIVVDGLVTTVGANKNAALETLETIRYCKANGLATICGLSNISFGLPERINVNAAFLTMAIGAGLTMAIANPNGALLVDCALASDLLLNKEGADIRYIKEMNRQKDEAEAANGIFMAESKTSIKAEVVSTLSKVREAVLKGNKKNIIEYTKNAIQDGYLAKSVLDDALLPSINEVGDLFDKGKYFLPQLIASAETMKTAIEYLEPMLLEAGGGRKMPTIIIATVEGDIHDIGKNLVALMLKNYGFKVIDLGKDVTKEEIVEKAKETNASIIALSALMTTTMKEMKHVIEYAKEQNVSAKVIIGGAVITQDYADEIGADGYSKDAAEAVKLTQRLLNL